MKFCSECESMLYAKEGEEGGLYGECNNCGNVEPLKDSIIQENIYKTSGFQDFASKSNMVYDPSLPHTITKQCPNENCPSRKDNKLQEAVVVTNPKTIKLTYICTICKTEWKYA